MHDKIIQIDKPAGWTSFDVVAKIRGKVRAAYRNQGITPTKRQQKVGHAGTLDPFATGLLIILIGGDATKRAGEFLKLDKTYDTTLRLGQVSTSGDPEGEISDYKDQAGVKSPPTMDEVKAVLNKFTGEIMQRPPAFSAIKVDGRRAYKLAREGKPVELPLRPVTIHSLELLDYSYPELTIRVDVSSGTYIRSLAIDIGQALDVGAYCQALRRTRVGDWTLDEAGSPNEMEIAAQPLDEEV